MKYGIFLDLSELRIGNYIKLMLNDFGQENYRLKVTDNGKNIPMSNAGELWDFLNSR